MTHAIGEGLYEELARVKRERDAARAEATRGIEAQTELEAIDDVVMGARPPEDFEPATGTLGRVIRALTAGRIPPPEKPEQPK